MMQISSLALPEMALRAVTGACPQRLLLFRRVFALAESGFGSLAKPPGARVSPPFAAVFLAGWAP